MAIRRQFDLLPEDRDFLDEYGLPWETVLDGSQWVLIQSFPTLHPGYNHSLVTVGIRLETGYPFTALDMVYVSPSLARTDGRLIAATEAVQVIAGVQYQRWSRHRTVENPWKAGRDSIGTHVILIEDWFDREFERCPLQ